MNKQESTQVENLKSISTFVSFLIKLGSLKKSQTRKMHKKPSSSNQSSILGPLPHASPLLWSPLRLVTSSGNVMCVKQIRW